MERIGQWCTALCIICLTTGVLIQIIPDGKIKQSVNIVYSILFLTTVISIFSGVDSFDINIEYSENIIQSYNNDMNLYITDMASNKIEEEIRKNIDSICKNSYSVESKFIQKENSYRLTEIKITVTKEDYQNAELIKSITGSLTGIIPEVKITDENQ